MASLIVNVLKTWSQMQCSEVGFKEVMCHDGGDLINGSIHGHIYNLTALLKGGGK